MDGLFLQFLLRTIVGLVFCHPLTHSLRDQLKEKRPWLQEWSQPPEGSRSVFGNHCGTPKYHPCQSESVDSFQPITARVGDDVVLPCQIKPSADVSAATLEWKRSNLFVLVWRSGADFERQKHPSYRGRTSLFPDKLKHGNISLKLSDVKLSDKGTYRCYIVEMKREMFVKLVVVSTPVSSPVISLSGMDRDRGGVVLQCESRGWYPEPEVLWLDAEGNLLSAGPPETVRGPDDLYTVSSRVTVDKRHNNSFTCRVQQKDTHQTREAHIHVPDDFFSSAVPIITGLAVSLAVSIMVNLACVFFVWRQNRSKTKKRSRDEAERGEKLLTEEPEKKKLLEETKDLREKYEKIEEELQKTKEELKNKTEEVNELKELEIRNKEMEKIKDELEKNKAAASKSSGFLRLPRSKKEDKWEKKLKEEEKKRERAEKEVETLKRKLETESERIKPEQTQNSSSSDRQEMSRDIDVVIGPDCKYICLRNKSDQDKPLGGRQLKVQINNSEPITYTFDPSMELKAGKILTLYPRDYDQSFTVPGPGDLVWKDLKSWESGDRVQVSLQ